MRPNRHSVQPYAPGTQWTFQSRESGYTQTESWCCFLCRANGEISDAYSQDDISAQELWQLWAKKANAYHERHPKRFEPGEVPIIWSVTKTSLYGIFELAPHTLDPRSLRSQFSIDPHEDFLSFYTHPVQDGTGEAVNWLRLPVVDRAWNATARDQGGFVQEATGWKPSALQPTMNVVQVARAAGLWVPEVS